MRKLQEGNHTMKFKINGVLWTIEEISQPELKKIFNSRAGNGEKEDETNLNYRYYGSTFCDICKIYLDKDLPTQRKRKTLIHELTHCYINNYITHVEKNYDEEMVADIVQNSHDIITKILDKYFSNA